MTWDIVCLRGAADTYAVTASIIPSAAREGAASISHQFNTTTAMTASTSGTSDSSNATALTEPRAAGGVVEVPFGRPGAAHATQESVAQTLAAHGLTLSETTEDLMIAAITAYTADMRVPRRYAFDRWTRDFTLHLPVHALERWERARAPFERLLTFLTGDRWTVALRQLESVESTDSVGNADRMQASVSVVPAKPSRSRYSSPLAQPLRADRVCLFSGGLDSFVGALDQLNRSTGGRAESGNTARPENSGNSEVYTLNEDSLAGVAQPRDDGEVTAENTIQNRVVLVGHYGLGLGPTSVAQHRALEALRRRYSAERAPLLQFSITPPTKALGANETTTRARSVLFLALGVAVAEAVQASTLIVPENGLISINVPLTPTRLGSFSTRTTHPHLIALLRETLAALELPIAIELPYRFRTKGEMLRECDDQETLAEGLALTMSCAHPSASRYERTATERNPNRHCGRCLPCLIRRAAIFAYLSDQVDQETPAQRSVTAISELRDAIARFAGVDPTEYGIEDLRTPLSPSKRTDIRACELALARLRRQPPRLADLLVAGPLPGTPNEQRAYLDLYRRGMAELQRLFMRSGV